MPQCARCDRNRHDRGDRRHAVGSAVKQHLAVARKSQEDLGLPGHQPRHPVAGDVEPLVARERFEHADVVDAEVSLVVLAGRKRQPFLGEESLVDPKVQRLAVGDHPVEVEDHALQRHFTFSPARIGTCRRLARGGIGTVVGRIVIAVRVVRAVEVDEVDAGSGPIEIEVPAGRIGLAAAGEIHERHEQPVQVGRTLLDKRAQRQRLAPHAELERADMPHVSPLPRGRRHLDRHALGRDRSTAGTR